MKRLIILVIIAAISFSAKAQTDTTMQVFVDSVCKCLSKVDMNTVKNQSDAQAALSGCILNENMNLLMKVAEKRGVDITDQEGMEKIGKELAIEMMKQNCSAFVQMSVKMSKAGAVADEEVVDVSSTTGTLSSVETKEFCKFNLTDAGGKKTSFYWLHHFKNSEKFTDQPSKYVGKKLKVFWQETEVYVPAAKGYYKIKEIKEIQIL